jgi:asparagine synthase (glutamine-hydrolysing)
MCGIVGTYLPKGHGGTTEEQLVAMRDRMAHRGPDGAGQWRSPDGTCRLGHRRLSIIDLSALADQPMLNDDGNVAIVFNGEIYNHADIRKELQQKYQFAWKTDHSDTEVILRAYEAWGLACVDKLIGMFAFAIYDGRVKGGEKLHLVRDRIGKKPIYVTRRSNGEWMFASEIRALLAHPGVTREMDRTAFWHYLTFIVVPAPLTMFRGIFKIPAGHSVTIRCDGSASATQYWDCVPRKQDTWKESELGFDEAAAELHRLLRQSVARRMVSDVPFGVLLSGGVDSSLNVALMSELMDRPVRTFSVGYDAYTEFNEFDHARRIADAFKTEHNEIRITSGEALDFLPKLVEVQDEPIADNVCVPLYFLAKLVKACGTTVVQVGEGADENFLGYWWCDHYLNKAQTVYEPARRGNGPLRKALGAIGLGRGGVGDLLESAEDRQIRARARNGQELFWGGAVCWWGEMRDKLTPDTMPFRQTIDCPIANLLPASLTGLDSQEVVAGYTAPLTGHLADPEILQKIPYLEMKIRLPEHLLMRVDKMTMAHSIEARVPFLDQDVVEFARRLPPRYKLDNGLGKKILKKVAENYLDTDVIYRKKQGFGAPMDRWLSEGEFGKYCAAAYQRSDVKREGFIDNAYFEGLLRAQMEGRINNGFHIWTVMNAVLWHEQWIS